MQLIGGGITFNKEIKFLGVFILLVSLAITIAACDTGNGIVDEIVDENEGRTYEDIDFDYISQYQSYFSEERINSNQDERNEIPNSTILMLKTRNKKLGKMQIIDNTSKAKMEFRFTIYSEDGSISISSDSSFVSGTFNYDLENDSEGSPGDFWWEHTEHHFGGEPGDPIYLSPRNGALFYVY